MALEIDVNRNTREVMSICEGILNHIEILKECLVDPTLTEVDTARIRGQILASREIVDNLQSGENARFE